MKLKDATTNKRKKSFVQFEDFGITFSEDKKRIVNIEVEIRKRKKQFKVVNGNVLAAFKRVEKYFKLKY